MNARDTEITNKINNLRQEVRNREILLKRRYDVLNNKERFRRLAHKRGYDYDVFLKLYLEDTQLLEIDINYIRSFLPPEEAEYVYMHDYEGSGIKKKKVTKKKVTKRK